MAAVWEFIGWGGLLPNEQAAAIYGGGAFLFGWLFLRSLFRGALERIQAGRKRRKKKRKKRGR
jgi:hypothetical protein